MATTAILIMSLLVGPGGQSELRALLVKDSWAYDVKIGRVAVERRVVTFCDDGRVRQRIVDDTGVHDGDGRWTLDETGETAVLVLSGDGLRERGRFTIRYLSRENAIELRFDGDDRYARVFRSVKGAGAPCTARD